MSGDWRGTVVESTGSQGIRFVLLEIAGTISGDVLYERGKVDNGVTGTWNGDTVKLVYKARTTTLTTTYEGTVSGGTFAGTVSREIGGQSAPGGTFEVTRE